MPPRRPHAPRSLVWIRDSSTPLFVINHRRQVASFNLGCERLTGWLASEVLGRPVEAVTVDQSDTVEAVLAALMPPAECWQGQPQQLFVQFPIKTGDTIQHAVHFWPIRDPAGAVNVILGIIGEPAAANAEPLPTTIAQTLHAELAALRRQLRSRYGSSQILGQSPAMRKALEQVRIAQAAPTAVLLVGESGVGREHLARAIHQGSPQSRRVFVRLDGRQTPATEIKRALRLAGEQRTGDPDLQPGTLFLADIDRMPADVHERLLEWFAAGREDVRIMASTSVNLPDLVEAGRFPEPLYHSLSPLTIALPPLRDRTEDLPALAQWFLEEHNRGADRQVQGFTDDVWPQLAEYRWPGNLDELAAVIREAREGCLETLIRSGDLPFRFRTGVDAQRIGPPARVGQPLDRLLEQTEREAITAVIEETRGNMTLAAERLGINRARLYRRMEQLGIVNR